jgi:predicted alpha/beta-fold hydrolase
VLSAASAAKYMASRTSDSTVEANKSSSSSSSMANMYEQLDGMDWTFIQLYVLERMQKEIKEKKKKEEEEDAVLVAPKRKSKHYPHSCFLHLILLMPCCRRNSPSKHKTNNTR